MMYKIASNMYLRSKLETMIRVVYTNPYDLKGEIDRIDDLFEAGLDELHIRKPGYSSKEMSKFIQQIDFRYWNRIVLHSHFRMSLKFNLKGIHISANKRRQWKFWWQRRYFRSMKRNIQISTTTSSPGKISKLYHFDKVFVGPLFNNSYENNNLFAVDESLLKSSIEKACNEIYAVGGINAENISFLWKIGFKGFVLQSTIWKSVDPVLAFHEVNSAEDINQLAS